MRDRLARAASRNALLAAGFAALMIYRQEQQGWGGRGRQRLVILLVLLALTTLVATALQARSRVERWSWTMTIGAFVLSMIGVSIAAVVALQVALAFR